MSQLSNGQWVTRRRLKMKRGEQWRGSVGLNGGSRGEGAARTEQATIYSGRLECTQGERTGEWKEWGLRRQSKKQYGEWSSRSRGRS